MTALYALDVGSALSYIVAVVVPALGALIPVLPSETAVSAIRVPSHRRPFCQESLTYRTAWGSRLGAGSA